jgi:S-adenosylmethionine uptake transporter
VKQVSTAGAFAVATLGIAAFSVMDAVMKGLSLGIGAYNALLWRTMVGAILGAAFFFGRRSAWPRGEVMKVHLARGILSAFMAILFFWGLARVQMALIALYLAAVLLKEKIERRAILASLLGFAGVIVIFSGQARAELGPEAFRGSVAILCSAALYAYNIILMRRQAQLAGPIEVAFFMSLIMTLCFLAVAPLWAEVPAAEHLPGIIGAALLAFVSLMLLSWAYARAEAQHLAPVEYTSFIWAAILGFLFFGERVLPLTLVGAAMIILACLIAASRKPAMAVDAETGL